jgi:hypothetical protein
MLFHELAESSTLHVAYPSSLADVAIAASKRFNHELLLNGGQRRTFCFSE